MATFQLHLYEADRNCYEGPCEVLTIPATDGSRQILAHHTNMIVAITHGTLSFRAPGRPARLAAVSGGLAKVEDNDVLVLVDALEWPEEIDEARASRRAAEAQEALLQKRSVQEQRIAEVTLARSLNRLKVKNAAGRTGI